MRIADRDFRVLTTPALVAGGLQAVLGLSWAVYAAFLPQLVVAAGLPRSLVPWILVLDQLVFAICDPWAGLAADRAAQRARRIGPTVAWLTMGCALAFALLPFTARGGSVGLMSVLLLGWAVGTAAMRAPLAALLARHLPGTDTRNGAWLGAGLSLAGVAGGYLIPAIRDASPMLAFGVVAVCNAGVVWVVVPAERWLLRWAAAASRPDSDASGGSLASPPRTAGVDAGQGASQGVGEAKRAGNRTLVLIVALGLPLALGMQLHTSVVAPAALAVLRDWPRAPLFWAGACLSAVIVAMAASRLPVGRLGAWGAAGGATAMAAFLLTANPALRTVLHVAAGAAWGVTVSSLFMMIFAEGRRVARIGAWAGALFAMLALATLGRLAGVTLGWWGPLDPAPAGWMAVACWGVGAAALAWLTAARTGRA